MHYSSCNAQQNCRSPFQKATPVYPSLGVMLGSNASVTAANVQQWPRCFLNEPHLADIAQQHHAMQLITSSSCSLAFATSDAAW